MTREKACPICEGTGHKWCKECGGTGLENFNPWEATSHTFKSCPRCQGSGRDPEPCPACKGTGTETDKGE